MIGKKLKCFTLSFLKVRKSRNDFFKYRFFSKKCSNEFFFTTIKPQVNLLLSIFLEEIEDTQKTFRNCLNFSYAIREVQLLCKALFLSALKCGKVERLVCVAVCASRFLSFFLQTKGSKSS